MAAPPALARMQNLTALVASYLRPWQRHGVSQALVDEAHLRWADYRDRDWGKFVPLGRANNRLLRVNILAGRLHYYTCTSERASPKRYARERIALELLQAALKAHAPLPDVDLVLSISDRPTVPRALSGSTPPLVFAYARTGRHLSVPFPPVTFAPGHWASLHRQLGSYPPLERRNPQVLWRGSCNSLCDGRQCTAQHDAHLLDRRALLVAGARCPALADVGITKRHKHCGGFAPKEAVAMRDHAAYAYLAHVDGNGFSGRLDELLTLGGVLLKQDSPFEAFYYPLLTRGVHYSPLRRDLSDLCATAAALRADPRRAAALAAAAAGFVRDVLAPDAVLAYVAALLRGYAALQRFTPRLHPRAVPWVPAEATLEARAGPSKGRRPPWRAGSRAAGGCSTRLCCRRHPRACTNASASTRRLQL